MRSAYSGNNVLTLCINKILAVEEILARSGITAEAYTRCRCVAHISEYHSLYVYSRTPFGRDAFHLAVEDGALVHPRIEHSADCSPKLFHRISRELLAGLVFDGLLKENNEFLELLNRQILVELHTTYSFDFLYDSLEWVNVFFVHRFHAKYHVTIHLHEATV